MALKGKKSEQNTKTKIENVKVEKVEPEKVEPKKVKAEKPKKVKGASAVSGANTAATAVKKSKKFFCKRNIIIMVLSICIAGGGLGLGLGLGLGGKTAPPPDLNELSALASTAIAAPNNATPADVSDPKMNAYHAFYAMNTLDSFVGNSSGATKSMGVTQKIKANRVVNKNEVYKDFIVLSDRKDDGDSYNFGALKGDKPIKATLKKVKLKTLVITSL